VRKKKKHDFKQLDLEEKELLFSFEKNKWRSIKNIKKEKSTARKIAIKTLHRDDIA
jgi:hypothetical protein